MAENSFKKMFDRKEPTVENTDNADSHPSSGDEDEGEDINEEEIASLNNQLDQLNNALDALEQKNDNIHAQLIELLQNNRQARQQFQQLQNQQEAPDNPDPKKE